ncbi:TfdA family taurine catabolism dioxygenase TauD [Actinokineospora cianjurensis]|uniref:TfdA family taurine catabolism dioxygenase TauD n=2 Tax=Actinokineospora cianjurensis TaxID=585224 RepID=A0A421B5V6_9PSEU|nr:TfdA family taurine catabolism dioxygenase TauD [Actinokineospora cianjurensis]
MNGPFGDGWIAADDRSAAVEALTRHGVALVEGLTDSADLLRVARSIATVVPHRGSASDGITTLVDLGSDQNSGFAGFSTFALAPHTDRSGVPNPPGLLVLGCEQPAMSGARARCPTWSRGCWACPPLLNGLPHASLSGPHPHCGCRDRDLPALTLTCASRRQQACPTCARTHDQHLIRTGPERQPLRPDLHGSDWSGTTQHPPT